MEMEKVKIEEIQSTAKKQRIATHIHINCLGLEIAVGNLLDARPGVRGLKFIALFAMLKS
ncbi:unnamed protein product [Eruca vesicaria subsp. sativa]|uniref:Uncharacterized protein n=1 Tax=Eruca vesicaria subsp. sativa TaxID=29727 RepID=A0ABC8L624_ERUVS|nr:unnamed protein product [Eruca vesicaria subsp. sativa]